MSATKGTSGFGTLLQRGDGGAGAAVAATKTIGTSNQQVLYTAKTPGTGGNAIAVAHVNGGVSQSLSVSVSSLAITVHLATDGSSVATSTASDVIDLINGTPETFALVDATNGTGNGSGLAIAAATGLLTGGTAGGEIFTTIAEITSLTGPQFKLDLIEATHMESPQSFREFIPSLLDSGELSMDLNFLPSDTNQQGLTDDQRARTLRNFRLQWTDEDLTTYAFSGYVTMFSVTAKIDDKLTATCTVRVTGPIDTAA